MPGVSMAIGVCGALCRILETSPGITGTQVCDSVENETKIHRQVVLP